MKPNCSNRRNRALTRVEVVVIIASVVLLSVILLSALSHTRFKANKIRCVSHLKQVGLAFRLWSSDHMGAYQMSLSTNQGGTAEHIATGETFRHFQVMSNELSTPVILVCPNDRRRPAKDFAFGFVNTNLSYFVGVDVNETNHQALLSGDYNITGGTQLPNGMIELAATQPCGWSAEVHGLSGNIAFADGSVQAVSIEGLQQAVQNSGLATNRLAIP